MPKVTRWGNPKATTRATFGPPVAGGSNSAAKPIAQTPLSSVAFARRTTTVTEPEAAFVQQRRTAHGRIGIEHVGIGMGSSWQMPYVPRQSPFALGSPEAQPQEKPALPSRLPLAAPGGTKGSLMRVICWLSALTIRSSVKLAMAEHVLECAIHAELLECKIRRLIVMAAASWLCRMTLTTGGVQVQTT